MTIGHGANAVGSRFAQGFPPAAGGGRVGACADAGPHRRDRRARAGAPPRPASAQERPHLVARLGDRACRVDLAPRTHVRRVVASEARKVTLDNSAPGLAFGELLWMDGANCGLGSPVISVEGAVLHLAEGPPFAPIFPAQVRLIEGCDKQLSTCRDRFSNAINFRGEAHLPGNDLLTRYPGG